MVRRSPSPERQPPSHQSLRHARVKSQMSVEILTCCKEWANARTFAISVSLARRRSVPPRCNETSGWAVLAHPTRRGRHPRIREGVVRFRPPFFGVLDDGFRRDVKRCSYSRGHEADRSAQIRSSDNDASGDKMRCYPASPRLFISTLGILPRVNRMTT